TRSATKHNVLVRDVADLARTIHEAFRIAASGRPGPVLIDIPKDVQLATAPYRRPEAVKFGHAYAPRLDPDPAKIAEAVELIARAERPIL
ncbi:acetolactate synthase large subunit, partial [Acinetobacter baumannii]